MRINHTKTTQTQYPFTALITGLLDVKYSAYTTTTLSLTYATSLKQEANQILQNIVTFYLASFIQAGRMKRIAILRKLELINLRNRKGRNDR